MGAVQSKELSESNTTSLINFVAAVLRGDDPVLKLLDNRIRNLFCFMCKWQNVATVPVTLKTGRAGSSRHTHNNSKELFVKAVGKEAKRFGFGLFVNELSRIGFKARNIIGLTLDIHNESILKKMLEEALGEDDRTR